MEKYEITYVTSTAGKVESVEKSIADLGGNVLESIDLGVKQFAFPVKKLTEARFVSVVFHIERENINALDKKVAQEKSIIRFILISALRARKEIKKRKGDKEKPATPNVAETVEPKVKTVETKPEVKPEERPEPIKEKPVAKEPEAIEKKAVEVEKTPEPKVKKTVAKEPKPEPKAKAKIEEEPSSNIELDEKLKELVED